MFKIGLILSLMILLTACGSPNNKPRIDKNAVLIASLVAQNHSKIMAAKSQTTLNIKNNNIVNLYLLAVRDKPYQLLSNSQQLLKNFHHYNQAQQHIIKPMLLWAYAHPIYRQETAKQVRLLQRETLLVAPSDIDFKACEVNQDGCANTLREQIAGIIDSVELTEILVNMANNDPCINLSNENIGGEFGNQCLASRKGDLKINLISKPQYLFSQWEAMLTSPPQNQTDPVSKM